MQRPSYTSLALFAPRNESTFARIADPLGYVDKDDIFHAIKAIVATQRDYGRRDDRRQARLKYLVDEWGIDKFRWARALGNSGHMGLVSCAHIVHMSMCMQ